MVAIALLFLILSGCATSTEETAPCQNGKATFDGPGPLVAVWEEAEGRSRNLGMTWSDDGESVQVDCTDFWTVVVVR